MLQRTAADIVGVPNTKITVEPVYIFLYVKPKQLNKTGNEMDQFTLSQT